MISNFSIPSFSRLRFCVVFLFFLGGDLLSQEVSKDSIPDSKVVENQLSAQEDSVKKNEIKFNRPTRKPKPSRAALYSIVPGGGQLYNWKYAGIKLPVLYGGFVGLGLWANYEEKLYLRFAKAYRLKLAGEDHEFINTNIDDAAVLLRLRDAEDKTRQQAYIAIGVVYLIQIVDAYVSAHLIDFDIDDDLSFRLKPSFENTLFGNTTGIGVVMEF